MNCPICNNTIVKEKLSSETLLCFVPIYKDEININPDNNIVYTEYECESCKTIFKTKHYKVDNKPEVYEIRTTREK